MVGSYSEDNICPKNYEYNNGIYVNTQGVSFSKKDLQLLSNDGVYTSEMIENMSSENQVEEAIHVAYDYLKINYKVVNETETNKIIVFPEFKEVDGNYKWEYNENENFYCLSSDEKSFAPFNDNECGAYEKFKMDEEWCKNYKNSTLIYEDHAEELCK